MAEELSKDEIFRLYGSSKLKKNDAEDEMTSPPLPTSPPRPENKTDGCAMSPRRSNPFAVTGNDLQVSPSLVCRGKRRIKLKNFVGFRPTVIDENKVETSKYFSSEAPTRDLIVRRKSEHVTNDRNPTSGAKIETDENYVIDSSETVVERETNFIEETLSQEKLSGSSGVFSSDSASEENSARDFDAIDKHVPYMEVKFTSENKLLGEENDLLDLQELAEPEESRMAVPREDSFEAATERKYFPSKNPNDNLRCSLFKWANSKETHKNSFKSTPAKSKPNSTAKPRMIRKTPSQGKITPGTERQQSLLQMFGFQKKWVIWKLGNSSFRIVQSRDFHVLVFRSTLIHATAKTVENAMEN